MNYVSGAQLATPCQRGLSNFHWTVRVAFLLYRWPSTTSDRRGHTATQDQVIVGRIDNCVDLLLDEIACDDQDSRRRHSSTSTTRSSNSL